MGRGLSELQQDILLIAYRNHVAEGRKVPYWRFIVKNALDRKDEVSEFSKESSTARLFSHNDYLIISLMTSSDDCAALCEAWLKARGLDYEKSWEPDCIELTEEEQKRQRELHRSWRTEGRRGECQQGCDLYAHEVLQKHFGFPVNEWHGYWVAEGVEMRHYRASDNGRNFNRKRIGEARYNAAMASTVRAIERLDERGLMLHGWHGYHLTEKGKALAISLSAKTETQ